IAHRDVAGSAFLEAELAKQSNGGNQTALAVDALLGGGFEARCLGTLALVFHDRIDGLVHDPLHCRWQWPDYRAEAGRQPLAAVARTLLAVAAGITSDGTPGSERTSRRPGCQW